MRRTLLICMLAALVGGCGGSAEVHERDLVVQDSAGAWAGSATPQNRPIAVSGAPRR